MMFTTDTRTETFLTQMGVQYRYTNSVTWAQLKVGWEKENLGRPVPLRDEAILEYAALTEAGSPPPATILHALAGRYNVLDGVQRLAAAELIGETQFSAYVVSCDSGDLLAAIRVLANARLQGRPEPPEWTRRRAVEVLVLDRSLSVAEVARMGGWKPKDIERIATVLKWGKTIITAGGPTLPDNIIETVSRCTTPAEITAAAGPVAGFLNTIKQAGFSHADAEPYVTEFFETIAKSSQRHSTYTKRLAKFQAQPEVEIRLHGRKGPELPRHVVLMRSLKAVETILSESEQGDPMPYVDEFFRLLKSIDEKLHDLAKRHPKKRSAAVPADKWAK